MKDATIIITPEMVVTGVTFTAYVSVDPGTSEEIEGYVVYVVNSKTKKILELYRAEDLDDAKEYARDAVVV